MDNMVVDRSSRNLSCSSHKRGNIHNWDKNHLQRYLNTGGSTIASGRASVTVTSGEAVAARETRHHVVLYALPTNTADIDVGPSGVASGSGFPMAPGATMTLETTAAIHADAASGTQTLAYIEVYS